RVAVPVAVPDVINVSGAEDQRTAVIIDAAADGALRPAGLVVDLVVFAFFQALAPALAGGSQFVFVVARWLDGSGACNACKNEREKRNSERGMDDLTHATSITSLLEEM